MSKNSELFKGIKTQERMYGTTVVGSRGQIVIPVEARKDLKLKTGDRLLVMGKFNKALGLVRADDLHDLIKSIMDSIADPDLKKEFRRHSKKLFIEHN